MPHPALREWNEMPIYRSVDCTGDEKQEMPATNMLETKQLNRRLQKTIG